MTRNIASPLNCGIPTHRRRGTVNVSHRSASPITGRTITLGGSQLKKETAFVDPSECEKDLSVRTESKFTCHAFDSEKQTLSVQEMHASNVANWRLRPGLCEKNMPSMLNLKFDVVKVASKTSKVREPHKLVVQNCTNPSEFIPRNFVMNFKCKCAKLPPLVSKPEPGERYSQLHSFNSRVLLKPQSFRGQSHEFAGETGMITGARAGDKFYQVTLANKKTLDLRPYELRFETMTESEHKKAYENENDMPVDANHQGAKVTVGSYDDIQMIKNVDKLAPERVGKNATIESFDATSGIYKVMLDDRKVLKLRASSFEQEVMFYFNLFAVVRQIVIKTACQRQHKNTIAPIIYNPVTQEIFHENEYKFFKKSLQTAYEKYQYDCSPVKSPVETVKGISGRIGQAAVAIVGLKVLDSTCEYIGIPFGASEALATIGSIVSVAGLIAAMALVPTTIAKSFDREKNYGLLINMEECRSNRGRLECLDALRAFNNMRIDVGKNLFTLALKALSVGGNEIVTGAFGENGNTIRHVVKNFTKESLLGSSMKAYDTVDKYNKTPKIAFEDGFLEMLLNATLGRAFKGALSINSNAVGYLRYLGYDQLALKMIGWTENDQTFNKDINKLIILDDEWYREIMPLTCEFINDPIEQKRAFDEKYCMSDDDTAAALKAIADAKVVQNNAKLDAARTIEQAARDSAMYEIRIGDKVNVLSEHSSRTRPGRYVPFVEQITKGFGENPVDWYLVNSSGSTEWFTRDRITPRDSLGNNLLPFAPQNSADTKKAIAAAQAAQDAAAAKKAAAEKAIADAKAGRLPIGPKQYDYLGPSPSFGWQTGRIVGTSADGKRYLLKNDSSGEIVDVERKDLYNPSPKR
jgi:hypothetical protein